MYTRDQQYMLSRDEVYRQLTAENEYARAWGKGKESTNPKFPGHVVSRTTGEPFDLIRWIGFAQKYIDEAKLADANYMPDQRAIRIRVLKAASLLVTALQVHGAWSDFGQIAGHSSNEFPIMHGGLQTFLKAEEEDKS